MKQDAKEQPCVLDPETLVGDILDLRALCLVVDLRSFTAAARAMGETKGTLSRRITRLERALGVSLLRRSPRLVEPTDDGVAYRMHVGRVLELLADANLAARGARAAPSGHLRVTAPTDLGIAVLARTIAAFGAAYPEVRVEMVVTDRVLDFDAEHIDVAFRVATRLPDTRLIAHKLFDIELIAVASLSYLREHRAPRRVDDLARHRLAFRGSTRGRSKVVMVHATSREAVELDVRPAMGASDFLFVKEVALAGAAAAILPRVLVTNELADGRLVRLLESYAVTGSGLHILHRGGRFLPPKVRVFVDHVRAAFGPSMTCPPE